MAIYRYSVSIVKRSAGRSSVAAAAYRAGAKIRDEQTGRLHDYSRKADVAHTEILAPDNAPTWSTDRAQLWNQVEASENRVDARLAREIQLALPRELTDEQRLELVRDYVRTEYVERGMIADLAIHRGDDDDQPHAHVLLTTRQIGPDGFGKKQRDWDKQELLEQQRVTWSNAVNAALAEAGLDARVDHRTRDEQRTDAELDIAAARRLGDERAVEAATVRAERLVGPAEPKIGPAADAMSKRGIKRERAETVRRLRRDRAELNEVNRRIRRIERIVNRPAPKPKEQRAPVPERRIPTPPPPQPTTLNPAQPERVTRHAPPPPPPPQLPPRPPAPPARRPVPASYAQQVAALKKEDYVWTRSERNRVLRADIDDAARAWDRRGFWSRLSPSGIREYRELARWTEEVSRNNREIQAWLSPRLAELESRKPEIDRAVRRALDHNARVEAAEAALDAWRTECDQIKAAAAPPKLAPEPPKIEPKAALAEARRLVNVVIDHTKIKDGLVVPSSVRDDALDRATELLKAARSPLSVIQLIQQEGARRRQAGDDAPELTLRPRF